MANIPLPGAAIKPTTITIHYPHVSLPISEPFCPVALSEYLRFGWQQCLDATGIVNLIHPNAPYRARA